MTIPTSVDGLKVDTYILNEEHNLPLVVEAASPSNVDTLTAWWRANRDWVDAQLMKHGTMLLRGFDVSSQNLLKRFSSSVSDELLDYVDGNSPRTKIESGVYTSTEYPAEYFISMHNELSYSKRWPARLYFCCVTPPQTGGETPLADSRAILRKLRPEIVDEFRSKGVRYIRNLHGGQGFGPSWQKTFETDDRATVESHAKSSGMDVHWLEDGTLRISSVGPATAHHPQTGEEVWFNQADHPEEVYESMMMLYEGREDQLPQHATFGDGSPIDAAVLDEIRATIREQLVLFPWRQGDLVVVDNMLVCHGRMPFTGPRKILVSMS